MVSPGSLRLQNIRLPLDASIFFFNVIFSLIMFHWKILGITQSVLQSTCGIKFSSDFLCERPMWSM